MKYCNTQEKQTTEGIRLFAGVVALGLTLAAALPLSVHADSVTPPL